MICTIIGQIFSQKWSISVKNDQFWSQYSRFRSGNFFKSIRWTYQSGHFWPRTDFPWGPGSGFLNKSNRGMKYISKFMAHNLWFNRLMVFYGVRIVVKRFFHSVKGGCSNFSTPKFLIVRVIGGPILDRFIGSDWFLAEELFFGLKLFLKLPEATKFLKVEVLGRGNREILRQLYIYCVSWR